MKQVIKRSLQLAILALGIALGAGAGAHSDEHLATVSAPHGGQLRMAGALHLELVLEPGLVKVYLSDHAFQPVSADRATGSATVLRGGKRVLVPLRPAGANLLTGKGKLDVARDARIAVKVTRPGEMQETAEFAPTAAWHPGHETR